MFVYKSSTTFISHVFQSSKCKMFFVKKLKSASLSTIKKIIATENLGFLTLANFIRQFFFIKFSIKNWRFLLPFFIHFTYIGLSISDDV